MTPEQIAHVRSSWAKVAEIAATAADLFYARLFELDPALRPMFPADLSEQKKKLMAMLGRVVASLHDLPGLVPTVRELGTRHVSYGVEPGHYATVGAALLWTLQQGLGEGFTPEVENAWATAYGVLSGVMTEAA